MLDFNQEIQVMTVVMGSLNLIVSIIMITYIVAALFRNQRHTAFVWINMSLLFFVTFFTAVGQLFMSNWGGKYCNYVLNVIYGFCTIILFCQALSQSYRNNALLFDIMHFARHGRLQSESYLKWRLRGILIATAIACVVLVIYSMLGLSIVLDGYEQYYKMTTLNSTSLWLQFAMFGLATVLCAFSIWYMKQI